ncbi:MAG: C40 family peptidase [Sciscionella sp.]
MRLAMVAGVLAVALLIVVTVSTGMMTSMAGGSEPAPVQNLACEASLGPFTGNGASDAAKLTAEQRGNAALIISIGKQRHLPPLAWQVALQAARTESGLRNLTYGDRDSLGLFQMRPSQGWGTTAQVTDPAYEINKFYDVMQAVPGWQSQDPGDTAQAVERSAFPGRYRRWAPMAASLLRSVGKVSDPTGCGQSAGNLLPSPGGAAGTAIQFALSQRGKPYVWGAEGPNAYDCSGLVERAYQAAGVTLERTSRQQFHDGAYLPVRQAQAGDLLFWATDPSNPATIHHVAIYLGNDEIVEAPETGVPVRTRAVNWDSGQLVGQAVRPGV